MLTRTLRNQPNNQSTKPCFTSAVGAIRRQSEAWVTFTLEATRCVDATTVPTDAWGAALVVIFGGKKIAQYVTVSYNVQQSSCLTKYNSHHVLQRTTVIMSYKVQQSSCLTKYNSHHVLKSTTVIMSFKVQRSSCLTKYNSHHVLQSTTVIMSYKVQQSSCLTKYNSHPVLQSTTVILSYKVQKVILCKTKLTAKEFNVTRRCSGSELEESNSFYFGVEITDFYRPV